MSHAVLRALPLLLTLAACTYQAPNEAAQLLAGIPLDAPSPGTSAKAVFATAKITLARRADGTAQLEAAAGALTGGSATVVLVGVLRDPYGFYRLMHDGAAIVIAAVKLDVAADGSFSSALGTAGKPIIQGDRVLLVPKTAAGDLAGEPQNVFVP